MTVLSDKFLLHVDLEGNPWTWNIVDRTWSALNPNGVWVQIRESDPNVYLRPANWSEVRNAFTPRAVQAISKDFPDPDKFSAAFSRCYAEFLSYVGMDEPATAS